MLLLCNVVVFVLFVFLNEKKKKLSYIFTVYQQNKITRAVKVNMYGSFKTITFVKDL